ncbi:Shedu immune nuclease family protein [Sphingomonas sp. PP-CC-3G-468]|uniref:Shedu immune nuclease family protein n=1 Tax=Sphingomonas sp. PP-CC-3G-468 TaxID=2135656 RepID=UPI000E720AF1|nr:Shedu immune nuclease family protein [Sphingomonas sp. PP-CC-3G-468]RKE42426.1 uncharacterized protein DUF4263 [Sphingomonas sp. PP-CC-1A-547]TCM03779.1 uncharacterized protein DUF4263 [Sphingomonas sp. PP-CC-3G-468]
MALRFEDRLGRGVVLEYEPESWDARWVWTKLRTEGRVRIAKVFHFERADLLGELPSDEDFENIEGFVYRFRFGSRRAGFRVIEGRRLGIAHDVRIADALPLERRLFVAHRDMSIFRGLSAVMPTGGEIVIGGNEEGSIPIPEFERLLTRFPTTTELDRYARARVADVVGQYVDGMADARRHYEEYMNRHKAIGATGSLDTEELLEAELAKYQLIRDTLRSWLSAAEVRVERDWQQLLMKFLLLIFPKYVAILENMQIADVYSTPGRSRRRFIDIALVDAAGNLDVIEIKRPRGGLLAGGDYRENGFPSRELSGTIMQAEKYLFHLSKWGLDGERTLTERYAASLPPGMSIRVTNPKAIVILGRDPTGGVWGEQAVDLEVVRRKYANVMDIMSYDDLLRRLDNVIASLRRRIDDETDI